MVWKKITNQKDFKVWRNQKNMKMVSVYRGIVTTSGGKSFKEKNMNSGIKRIKSHMKRNK